MNPLRKAARKALNNLLGRVDYQLVRVGEQVHIRPYIPFKQTLNEATRAGLSVGDYIDQKFLVPGATQSTVDHLVALKILDRSVRTVCEIGPGSGRYLEKVQRLCAPSSYEIYETDQEWADWLTRSYRVTTHPADGTSLRNTVTESVDLVHAHKVFTCLRSVVTCHYFFEMIRIVRPGGVVVFDVVSESCMPDETIKKFNAGAIYYPCLTPRQFVIDLFTRGKCSLRNSFFSSMMPGQSEYFVFVKDAV